MQYERRDERFALVLNSQERAALDWLAREEALSQAALLRRLLLAAVKAAGQPAQPTLLETTK